MIRIKESPNNKKVYLRIANLDKINKQAIRKAFYYVGKDLVTVAKSEIMKKPKHGITYRVSKGGRVVMHTASAPGESPANLTGNLKRGLDYEVQGSDEMIFGVKDTVNYAGYLEDGTSKMKSRPYLITSIKENYGNIQKHFEERINRELNKSSSGVIE